MAVVNCGQLVTLAGAKRPRRGAAEMRDLAVVRDGAFLVRGGRIAAVGTRDDIERRAGSDVERVDAGGRAVLPGFVDAHTHPVFAGTRVAELELRAAGKTYREIADSGGGIASTAAATRAATEEDLLRASERYAQWFLRCGTTTVEAKSGYGLTVEAELKILRVIRTLAATTPLSYVPTFLGAHTVPEEYRGRRAEFVGLVIRQMLPAVVAEGLAEYCDVFCEAGAFSWEEAERILMAARAAGLKLRIHADQLAAGDGAHLAARVGAATADHLEYTNAEGIAALARAGVQPVLLPGSVLTLGGSRYPDARRMMEAGLAVVLATDFNPGSSPTPSLPLILALAVSQLHMTPEEALTAATVNAAYSLGRGYDRGTLEPGKRADFVIHDCDDYRELAYFLGVEQTLATYVEGRRVYFRW